MTTSKELLKELQANLNPYDDNDLALHGNKTKILRIISELEADASPSTTTESRGLKEAIERLERYHKELFELTDAEQDSGLESIIELLKSLESTSTGRDSDAGERCGACDHTKDWHDNHGCNFTGLGHKDDNDFFYCDCAEWRVRASAKADEPARQSPAQTGKESR